MPDGFIKIGKVDELRPGSMKRFDINGRRMLLANVNGRFCATDDTCTHDGGELASGTVEGEEIVCPRHGARFNIKTGAVTAPPAYEPVYKFPLRVEDGTIQIRDDRWD